MADLKISQVNGGVTVTPAAGDKIIAARAGANVLLDPADIGVPNDFQPAIVTENYYYCPNVAIRTISLFGGSLVAFPIWFSSTETWTRVGFKLLESDAGKSARLGLYANGTGNLPGALVSDFGALALDATGDLEITISRALTANTVYWLACVANTDPGTPDATIVGMSGEYGSSRVSSGNPRVLGTAEPIDSGDGMKWAFGPGRAFAYAALPNPFGTPDGSYDAPAIWLRKV